MCLKVLSFWEKCFSTCVYKGTIFYIAGTMCYCAVAWKDTSDEKAETKTCVTIQVQLYFMNKQNFHYIFKYKYGLPIHFKYDRIVIFLVLVIDWWKQMAWHKTGQQDYWLSYRYHTSDGYLSYIVHKCRRLLMTNTLGPCRTPTKF